MYILDAYDDALRQILDHGVERTNQRTGFRTKSIFGITSRYNLTNAFPIVTRRKVWPKAIWAELLWFISGSTCNKDLQALRSNIWTPWVDSEFEQRHGYAAGCFGPVYGFQLRHLGGNYGNGIGGDAYTIGNSVDNENAYGKGGFDQLAWMIDCIKEDPSSRRLLFMLWSPKDISRMKLPPCHYTYQVLIDDAGCMTGIMTQRSGDYYIGCCANVQFYSALTMMIARQTGYTAYEFVHEVHDSHIYMNQIESVEKYLSTPVIDSPVLQINKAKDIFGYTMDDFVLENYQHGPVISAPVAV